MANSRLKTVLKVLLIVPPIILAVLGVRMMMQGRKGIEKAPLQEVSRAVRVVAATRMEVVPRALGYGSVRPGKVWKAVAQVPGKVVEMSPLLKSGQVVREGTVLIQLDRAEYLIAISRLEASLEALAAQLEQLNLKEKNDGIVLEISKRSLALMEKELDRSKGLMESGNLAVSTYEKLEREYLQLVEKVQTTENALALVASSRKQLESSITGANLQLDEAKLKLSYTTITAPFTARVSDVMVEVSQFAGAGAVLAICDGMETAEVNAQFAMPKLRYVMSQSHNEVIDLRQFKEICFDDIAGLTATVRVIMGEGNLEWKATLGRVSESLDPLTRTVGLILIVDDPYGAVVPGTKPPLIKGMYCEVEIAGKPHKDKLVVPRTSLTNGSILVCNAEKRLERRPVKVEFVQADFAVLANDTMKDGEFAVVSDMATAIEGMLLDPMVDDELAERVRQQASGSGSVR